MMRRGFYRLGYIARWRERDELPPALVDDIAENTAHNPAVIKWRRQLVAALQLRDTPTVLRLVGDLLADQAIALHERSESATVTAGAFALVCADIGDQLAKLADPHLWARAEAVADELIAAAAVREALTEEAWNVHQLDGSPLGAALAELAAVIPHDPEISP